ncbi:DUF1811 family protein [Paenibacillus agricola]|uniref:DUF1811 family protein n=1 Tax=Paenibacillus agricola TaxID=2716264 RepID=A0ABX0IYC4_9BACL|nr:DUF1811 family protein [Paenibacillus agricola]NHN28536.1 DUF1811 family protein [Paenibacillus agricola]
MKKLYSQMSIAELDAEIVEILEAIPRAEFPSQKEQLERKYYTAKAYMLDSADFPPGLYAVEGSSGERFLLEYINGIMGWGVLDNQDDKSNREEASYPLSMLKSVENRK